MKELNTQFATSYLTPSLPENTRVYCIGDIHGCYELLKKLTYSIEEDMQAYKGRIIVIYLGDFIDRGNSSKKVIQFFLDNQHRFVEYIYLRGNHEQMLLDFFSSDVAYGTWLYCGGMETLASYNIDLTIKPAKPADFIKLRKQLHANLPVEHYQFLNETTFSYSLGSYFFVHAGINPYYSLTEQQPAELLRIRGEFTNSNKSFEKIIVHGHTITDKAELLPNRIGIDTGAYTSGILTCLVLEAHQQRLIQTGI